MEILEAEFPPLWEILRGTDDPQNHTVLTLINALRSWNILPIARLPAPRAKQSLLLRKTSGALPRLSLEYATHIQALEKLSATTKE